MRQEIPIGTSEPSGREETDVVIDKICKAHRYSAEQVRNVLVGRLEGTAWFQALDPRDGARAALQEMAKGRDLASAKSYWWAMCFFALEDGVKITVVPSRQGPVLREEPTTPYVHPRAFGKA